MMEVFGETIPVWEIQAKLAKKVLHLNELLTGLESGDLRFKADDWIKFLHLVLELETIFSPELSAVEETRQLVEVIEHYKRDKESFVDEYPHLVFAWFFNSSTKEKVLKQYTNAESFVKDVKKMKEREFELQRYVVLPSVEIMTTLAKSIVTIGLQMDILRPRRREKPSAKFGDVYGDRGASDLSVEKLRRG